jgi:hypothetical protein
MRKTEVDRHRLTRESADTGGMRSSIGAAVVLSLRRRNAPWDGFHPAARRSARLAA